MNFLTMLDKRAGVCYNSKQRKRGVVMRTWAAICRVGIWIVTVLMLFFQILTVMGIKNYDTAVGAASSYEVAPLVLATALMTVTVIVFFALRRGRLVPLIIAAVLGLCFVALAHSLHVYYGPPTTGVIPDGSYLTVWKALYRHALPVLIPFMMIPGWLVQREDNRAAEAAAEAEPMPSVLEGFTMSSLDE